MKVFSRQTLENTPVSPFFPIFWTLVPLGVYLLLRAMPHYDHHWHLVKLHFYAGSTVLILAALVSMVIGVVGTRLRNVQIIFASLAFLSLAAVFGMHALSTPGFILGMNRIVGVTVQLSITLTALWLFASSLPSNNPVIKSLARFHTYLVPAWTTLLLGTGIVVFTNPELAALLPVDSNPFKFALGFISLELFVLVAWRYWQSYAYTRSPLQLAVVYSSGWLAVSQIIILTSNLWEASWWLYHLLFVMATLSVVRGLLVQYGRKNLKTSLIGLNNATPIERLEAALSPGVKTLIEKTETHDAYTAGHNQRVAMYAVQLGEKMGLSAAQLRLLAQAGAVHDLGKLHIPTRILNKPDKLTPEERLVIEQHPVTGWEFAKRLGFMSAELEIIRHHHERFDGTGYPDKLEAEAIPLLARMIAVADVYDALTSERAYRKPWSKERANSLLLEEAGKQFDPACVQAWLELQKDETPVGEVGPEASSTSLSPLLAV
jgi:HD-GYP domain-containing protein (c-di-GMP phosphodiesterase class II)